MLLFQLLLLRWVALLTGSLGAEDSGCLGTGIREPWDWIGESTVRVWRVVESLEMERNEVGRKKRHGRSEVSEILCECELRLWVWDKENSTRKKNE